MIRSVMTTENDSDKWARLREIAEVIAAKQEKMLVFREVIAPLPTFLESVFGRPGLVLHGETEVKKRKEVVRRFQEDEAAGFFVLSLKAGGLRTQPYCRLPCGALRPVVEPGGREPSYGSCLPHRPD